MIGKISGIVEYRTTDHVLIDVRGVGYVVYCSDRVLATLPGKGEAVALYTDLLVREDLLQLFGFSTLLEKEWHRLLMSVQGIGAKASLAILGTLGAEGVGRAIALSDVTAIKAAKGIGPKTAQRVVIELKDRAPEVMALAGSLADAMGETSVAPASEDVIDESDGAPAKVRPGGVASGAAAQAAASVQADAMSALANLGYGPSDAAQAVAQVSGENGDADAATLIRLALKLLAPKG
ncbi:Holliday junction ATP-dependent DNA helicase RuvA [Shimia sp. SK013]|uniref:Holliday junction branch migration protein RuvA n=1 Tax=Shimia sp. SK013 TaxID=1389006 RepID=UPI0006B56348|nr:Holliday junction branch migration protein RuvA [Shimia sp. SK013]KPA20125.1 Holliday junction ATP-dependent DNA helicase RuvA [Shimia sp. SK013]